MIIMMLGHVRTDHPIIEIVYGRNEQQAHS